MTINKKPQNSDSWNTCEVSSRENKKSIGDKYGERGGDSKLPVFPIQYRIGLKTKVDVKHNAEEHRTVEGEQLFWLTV